MSTFSFVFLSKVLGGSVYDPRTLGAKTNPKRMREVLNGKFGTKHFCPLSKTPP